MPFYFALSLWSNGMVECCNGGGKRGKKLINCQQMPIIPSNASFHYSITPIFQVQGVAEPSYILVISIILFRCPGTDPFRAMTFNSGLTSRIFRFLMVVLWYPVLPGSFFPLWTLPGVALEPMEPGILWDREPCVSLPLEKPHRLMTPLNPRPLLLPVT
jgi:hypothetical protein